MRLLRPNHTLRLSRRLKCFGVDALGSGSCVLCGTEGAADMIRFVLLDVDGTLLDSNDQHAQAWVDALHQHAARAA